MDKGTKSLVMITLAIVTEILAGLVYQYNLFGAIGIAIIGYVLVIYSPSLYRSYKEESNYKID